MPFFECSDPDEAIVSCDCCGRCRQLHLYYESDIEYLELYVGLLGEGSTKMSWRERLRHVWQILRQGRPWVDDMTLCQETIKDLAHWLGGKIEEKQLSEEKSRGG